MNRVDVAIIGGGSAGSVAATLLARAGISSMICDMHQTSPPEFRCEKVHDDQVRLLRKIGLADQILATTTPIPVMWEARRGFLIGRMQRRDRPWEYGCAYEELVASFRRQIPPSVPFINAKATSISTSDDVQTVTLSNGETWTARLIIIAIGLNNNLLTPQGITRSEISKCHSISIGFDIANKNGFKFPALTYFAERAGPAGYVSIFPINDRMRLNWFLYHDVRDPWVKTARATPVPVLLGVMPRLRKYLEGAEIASDISMRPVDLNTAMNCVQPGLVLAGDAHSTSCPAAGTGLNKVLVDVERLAHYIPRWLVSPGMGVEKIRSYYNDPAKIACDKWSMDMAFYQRALSIDNSFNWRFRRWMWIGARIVQGLRARIEPSPPSDHNPLIEHAADNPGSAYTSTKSSECPTLPT